MSLKRIVERVSQLFESDEERRKLERAVAAGDHTAYEKLMQVRRRSGEIPDIQLRQKFEAAVKQHFEHRELTPDHTQRGIRLFDGSMSDEALAQWIKHQAPKAFQEQEEWGTPFRTVWISESLCATATYTEHDIVIALMDNLAAYHAEIASCQKFYDEGY